MSTSILVTGGAKGLGRAVCVELARCGHSLILHYQTSCKEAEETANACKSYGVHVDLLCGSFSTSQQVEVFLKEYESRGFKTKGIVNNVGNFLVAKPSETSPQQWMDLFQTNLHAPLAIIHSLLPSLKEHKGTIVNIGTAGLHSLRSNLYSTAYTATKSSLWYLTVNLAKELAPFDVTVNMVSPGFMENAVDLAQAFSTTEKENNKFSIPMKRPALLAEVAHIVGFFFQEENHYITGQNIEVAGGFGL